MLILPETFVPLLAAFQPCFTAPSYRTFCVLVGGWVQCQGRRTITGVVIAAGAVGSRHISVFHRFFARVPWSLDALGRVVWTLALAWISADQPLLVLIDPSLRSGQAAGAQGRQGDRAGGPERSRRMHHDPLLSSARKPFCSFGHVWVVLALWVPLPMGSRGFALPLLFRLYVGSKRGGQADAPSRRGAGPRVAAARAAHAAAARPTKLELARELLGVVAGWAGERTIVLAADSAYAGRAVLEHRPANVEMVGPLRMDAALWARPGRREPGQRGRPRRRGRRLPSPKTMAATRRRWDALPLTLYGRAVSPRVFALTALWYGAFRDRPLRIIVVRDPGGHRRDQAFFCTDLAAGAAFVLETYARRWTLEVTFHDTKQALGFEDAQQQVGRAVQRTAPVAALVYDLVLLWYAQQVRQGRASGWLVRPWYRSKAAPSFPDMLTAVRQDSRSLSISPAPCPTRCRKKPAHPATRSLPTAA
jgi:hypothetical protein